MQEVTVQVPQVASLYLISSAQLRSVLTFSQHFYIAGSNHTVKQTLLIPPAPPPGDSHGGDGGDGGGGDGGDIWCGMLSAGPVTEDLIIRAIKHAWLNPGAGVSTVTAPAPSLVTAGSYSPRFSWDLPKCFLMDRLRRRRLNIAG